MILTDHMKLNKKEDKSVNASIPLRRWNKIINGAVPRWEREKGGRIRYGGRQKRSLEGQENE